MLAVPVLTSVEVGEGSNSVGKSNAGSNGMVTGDMEGMGTCEDKGQGGAGSEEDSGRLHSEQVSESKERGGYK